MPATPTEAERLALVRHRSANPRSRAPGVFVYGRNGRSSKSIRCVVDGWESLSWCPRWPRTRQVERSIEEHRAYLFGAEARCA